MEERMSTHVGKNYFEDGGDTLVIGGKLQVEEGAEVSGLPSGGGEYTLPAATETTLGGVKVGAGLSITEEGVLSADGITPAQTQEECTATELTDVVTAFNSLLAKLKAAGLMASGE
jgi:hypothetical protein